MDTIYALASGPVRAAVAILRISGPATGLVLERLAGGVPPPRTMALRTIRDPDDATPLDRGLVVSFPAPHSFTGEDQAELHCHGGPAVRSAILGALARIPGCRPAEPGEFTRRAFLNGRLDLTAVEGLADLIDAETEAQRRQALRQMEGGFASRVEAWREALILLSARLEAHLDFADEGDVGEGLDPRLAPDLAGVLAEIRTALADGRRGERLREGFVVVLAGPPNAGKSTLLNALAGRDVAIVSAQAGTTRDAIEVRCDLDGLPVIVVDTAGLRDSRDSIELEGMRRTRAQMGRADLVLWLDPLDDPAGPPQDDDVIVVRTKADLGGGPEGALAVSARTGAGLTRLLDVVTERARTALGSGDALLTRERHRIALDQAAGSLDRALVRLREEAIELAAEDIRLALRAIGAITGRIDVEHMLDRLFASFCIGK